MTEFSTGRCPRCGTGTEAMYATAGEEPAVVWRCDACKAVWAFEGKGWFRVKKAEREIFGYLPFLRRWGL